MQNTGLQEYKFCSIYQFVSIVTEVVDGKLNFWNFNNELFVQSALKFKKISLLHIFVSCTLYNYYSSYFKKSGDCVEEDDIEWWIDMMKEYDIKLKRASYNIDKDGGEATWVWFQKNENTFLVFFEVIADEIVHILFNDKQFLVKFNRLVRDVIIDEDGLYADIIKWPDGTLNENGTIKRCIIPQWVKNAVYHRDKGRCVFCNKDLTGLVNMLNKENFDHIIPLKDYGTNDPCNIQLTCETCNKSKGGKDVEPKYKYQSWW